MNCPICNHGEHRVLETRERGGRLRRTRECIACAHRWRTLEVPEAEAQRFAELADAWRAMGRIVGE